MKNSDFLCRAAFCTGLLILAPAPAYSQQSYDRNDAAYVVNSSNENLLEYVVCLEGVVGQQPRSMSLPDAVDVAATKCQQISDQSSTRGNEPSTSDILAHVKQCGFVAADAEPGANCQPLSAKQAAKALRPAAPGTKVTAAVPPKPPSVNNQRPTKPSPSSGLKFLSTVELGVTSALQLDGAFVCVLDTKKEMALASYFEKNGMQYEPVLQPSKEVLIDLFLRAAACDVVFGDETSLKRIVSQSGQSNLMILPESIPES